MRDRQGVCPLRRRIDSDREKERSGSDSNGLAEWTWAVTGTGTHQIRWRTTDSDSNPDDRRIAVHGIPLQGDPRCQAEPAGVQPLPPGRRTFLEIAVAKSGRCRGHRDTAGWSVV